MTNNKSYKKGGMFEGALPTVFANAKALRNNMTDAESILWMHLKSGIGGCRFRRQHPLGLYIADFYCHKAKLVVEVDGSIHALAEVQQNDEEKEAFLIRRGYKLIRFANQEIFADIEKVLQKISTTVTSTLINTLRRAEAKSPLQGVWG